MVGQNRSRLPIAGTYLCFTSFLILTEMKRKIAIGFMVLLSLIGIAFGLRYLITAHLMNYHIAFLRMAEAQLIQVDNRIVLLFLVLIRITGGCMISIGITALIITLTAFRRQEPWAWWSLLSLFSFSLVTLGIITYHVARDITLGPRPPWWLATGMLVVLAAALFLLPPKKKTP
jgi:hypothetical protein